MHGLVIFSKLDLKIGYHQLKLDEDSQNITTFMAPMLHRLHIRNKKTDSLEVIYLLFQISVLSMIFFYIQVTSATVCVYSITDGPKKLK